ncbi:MAG: sodium ion-translocating decarboxylase subunit beta [Alphaproteobacteria bacterium]|nr:sodium ion-translocating decarboxylase subunit beta [Alphaproteobacteria bacterium]
MLEKFLSLWEQTGLYGFFGDLSATISGGFPLGIGQFIMLLICLALLYLGIAKKFEPLLLVPIAFGGILANIPFAGLVDAGTATTPPGLLHVLYQMGIANTLFPLLIFMGVGAMTDFSPVIANPKTFLLGAAAQFGIFGTLLGALWLGDLFPFAQFSMKEAASIGIIGGADGPTSIYLTTRLAPDLLAAVAVAAYSYMALVPIIQPPIMRALTTQKERQIKMRQLRDVSQKERILFPLTVLLLCVLFFPSATPLIGALMFGNLLRESGVTDRLSDTLQNALINTITIFLGLAVGSKMIASSFLVPKTLFILVLGVIAFSLGTASGVLMAKLMNVFCKEKINPLIGSAGVSAIPMAARVSNKLGQQADPSNYLLMHAMGPNVAGSIGSAVAAGILLTLCG